MTGRTFDGRPLTPGVNVDALDIKAGATMAASLSFTQTHEDRMVVAYALQRHARGEEDGAEQTWMGHFGKDNLTGWKMVLAAAMAGAVPEPPELETIHVVFDGGGYEDGDVIAASRDRRIADAISGLGYGWGVKEVDLVTSLEEVEPVTVYTTGGARMSSGLWNIHHHSDTTWKRRVTCGEADILVHPADPVVTVIGTNESKVREVFEREALAIEAGYGHDKLRTQVEELDPIERF